MRGSSGASTGLFSERVMKQLFIYETGAVILLGLLLFYRTSTLSELKKLNEENSNELLLHSGINLFDPKPENIKYLYLVQSGRGYSDLTVAMKSNDSEVLVLSWDVSVKADITVSSAASWSSRRNTLYAGALHLESKRNRKYEYFIFVDDLPTAIDLEPPTPEAKKHVSTSEAWRKFESLLVKYHPAVAVLGQNVDPNEVDTQAEVASDGILSVGAFEETVNAFQRDAIKHLLPYETTFDGAGETWKSHAIMIYKAFLLYKHHVLLFSKIFLHLMEPSPMAHQMTQAEFIWESDISPLFIQQLPENFWPMVTIDNLSGESSPPPLNKRNGQAFGDTRVYWDLCPLPTI
eukprot:TRINITY_DN5269_c0_g1_i1.p1 TRINITY_DN5269_c0_g1~~TRINITY_DN5269_c0_g1_i1.p1  ORF type:complete len:348 (-),score=44.61 TRINITY_DN5269_c0_g1_i1:95-1138(-)